MNDRTSPVERKGNETGAEAVPAKLDDATQRPLYTAAFNDRHEFDIFPSDELRSGAFNEFVAGWYAALCSRSHAPAAKSVATVRVRHGGYAMELSTHVAYALPEGMHDLYAAPVPAMSAEAVAIDKHDLNTSAGGRGYIAEFFAKRLRRHDFGRYIKERLAADFACALAQYLSGQDAAQQPGRPDARGHVADDRKLVGAREGLTAVARATIMDACQSISRSADALKAGCSIDDEWRDADDKAFYEAELRLLERLVALLDAHPGQPEPTHRCITCGATGIPDEVIGCKTCGFDDMQPLKSAPEPRAEGTDDRPRDCSGDPSNCPDNEGRGCWCSDVARAGGAA